MLNKLMFIDDHRHPVRPNLSPSFSVAPSIFDWPIHWFWKCTYGSCDDPSIRNERPRAGASLVHSGWPIYLHIPSHFLTIELVAFWVRTVASFLPCLNDTGESYEKLQTMRKKSMKRLKRPIKQAMSGALCWKRKKKTRETKMIVLRSETHIRYRKWVSLWLKSKLVIGRVFFFSERVFVNGLKISHS